MTTNDNEQPGAKAELPRADLSNELWEQHADWWQREFTEGVDPEYTEQILPVIRASMASCATVLDIGTGEGQVARMLAANGHTVIGADPVGAQIDEARSRGAGPIYVRAPADRLPFSDASFDGALACLVFEHIDLVDEAISEAARVVRSGGTFLLLLNHPLLQTPNSGWIDDQFVDPPEQYWRVGHYLREAATVEEVQKDVFIRFIHRPLSRYVNALADSSLVLTKMTEPAPPPGFLGQAPQYLAAATIPRLLVLQCRKS